MRTRRRKIIIINKTKRFLNIKLIDLLKVNEKRAVIKSNVRYFFDRGVT